MRIVLPLVCAAALGSLILWSSPPASASVDLGAPNPVPWIPAQCWAKASAASNGCYVCHQTPRIPNFVDDEALQTQYAFARAATRNPWKNVFTPPAAVAISDEALLSHVRISNYTRGRDGDCSFDFDSHGFDRDPAGNFTGWRAFAYLPLPGAFLPTNGSDGDAAIRLPRPFRESTSAATTNLEVYRLNLALVEAFVRRADVEIAPVDETAHGVDLDGDGVLGLAHKIAFEWPVRPGRPLHYVGKAAFLNPVEEGSLVAGLFPRGTEFLHTLRYFDVVAGEVRPAARLKEVRRMQKTRWLSYSQLEEAALGEAREKSRSPNLLRHPIKVSDGMLSGTGWVLQGTIEDSAGTLRPQTPNETTACIGCHGGVGANTDSTFSFARKLPGEAGWRYVTKTQLGGTPDPLRADGEGEYAHWLKQVGSADDFHSNVEADRRFFFHGRPRPEAFATLAKDVSSLLTPSPQRALALNRAYLAVVQAQSFTRGREVTLSVPQAHEQVEQDQPTGITEPVAPAWARRPVAPAR